MSNNISYKQKIITDVWKFLPILDGEELAVNTPLVKYGADALDIANMLVRMEETYNIKFKLNGLTIDDITILNIAKMLKHRPISQPIVDNMKNIAARESKSIIR